MEGLVGLGLASILFAGPLPSEHLGGQGLVIAAHRVVMGTLRTRHRLLVAQHHSLRSSFVDEYNWKLRKHHSVLKALDWQLNSLFSPRLILYQNMRVSFFSFTFIVKVNLGYSSPHFLGVHRLPRPPACQA